MRERYARLATVASLVLVAFVAASLARDSGGLAEAQVAANVDEAPVELTGPVSAGTDSDGDKEYKITVEGKAIQLDAGPRWFYGDDYPLAPFVGKTVTVKGKQGSGPKPKQARNARKAKGSEVDVLSVTSGGKTTKVRSSSRPAWAGGPKAVGEKHPGYEGWSRGQEKANGEKGGKGP